MKTLIFALLISTFAVAQDPGVTLSDQEISNKLVSVAKDIENQNILAGATQLQPCRDDFQRRARQPGTTERDNIDALERCLGGKISPSDAAALSDSLSLQAFKLIPSKTVQNVTKYLTKNLYRELTGVDIEEADTAKKLQSMKFKTMKQVDHKVFFDLYKNQIAKNVLYEVSRFCLQDFRNKKPGSGTQTTFIQHWNNLDAFADGQDPKAVYSITELTDDSTNYQFLDTNTSSKTPAPQTAQTGYAEIMRNVFNTRDIPDSKRLSKFFFFCGQKINELCQKREDSCQNTNVSSGRSCAPGIGEKACLTKSRLVAFRSALKDTDKVVEDFMTNGGTDVSIALKSDQIIRRYTGGGNGDKSLNELTNEASAAFFKANENESTQEASDCIQKGGSNCERFEIVDDSEVRIEANTNIAYTVKREAELQRVRELKAMAGDDLKKYLEAHYPDLKPDDSDLINKISHRWDSERQAMIDEIKKKIGERQISSAAANTTVSPGLTKREDTAKKNARDVLTEKTRLAQVVFFNNVISSSLDLKTTSGTSLGRNIQALNNEVDSAEELQPGLFTDLKSRLGTQPGSSTSQMAGNETVTNLEFLDQFIGVQPDPGISGPRPATTGRPD
jgi:hypothetical protein